MQMEPNTTEELPLNDPAPPATEKKPGRGGGKPFASRPDIPAVKQEILLRGAQRAKGFTTLQARRWVKALKLGKKPPGMEFVYKRLREMTADGLIERIGTDGKRNRTYRIVKNGAVEQSPLTGQPKVLHEAEEALKRLEARGEDTTRAREALEVLRDREIKAQLEVLLK